MDSAARVGSGDQYRALVCQKTCRILADRPETLHNDARARKFEVAVLQRNLGCMAQPPAGCPDLIQRNAANFARQRHNATDFVLYPSHAHFVGTHVRREDIILGITQGVCEGAYQSLLVGFGHLGITVQNRFSATMGQARGGVFQGHGPGQPRAFTSIHIRRHTNATNRRSLGNVIDNQDSA